jgi:formyl-CoA transferase
VLDAAFASRTLTEWRPLLDAAGLTFDAVATTAEAAAADQPRATGAIRETVAGGWTVDSPLHIAGEAKSPARLPPNLAGDEDAILSELGYTPAEIRTLREAGALGRR